jgi:DNA-binding transcriptional MerR regulator
MELIDLRPYRFLQEIHDNGSVDEACEKAGFTVEELEQLLSENNAFRIAAHECVMEFGEQKILDVQQKKREALEQVYTFFSEKLDRETAHLIQELRDGSSG